MEPKLHYPQSPGSRRSLCGKNGLPMTTNHAERPITCCRCKQIHTGVKDMYVRGKSYLSPRPEPRGLYARR